jgi:hypothetical protein
MRALVLSSPSSRVCWILLWLRSHRCAPGNHFVLWIVCVCVCVCVCMCTGFGKRILFVAQGIGNRVDHLMKMMGS